MKNTISRSTCASSLSCVLSFALLASCFSFACSDDDGADSGDGDGDTCSDEEYSPDAGGAAPVGMCEAPEPPTEDISIVGTYDDAFGGTVTITTETWDDGFSVFSLSLVDNEAGFALARNSETDAFNPCLWSKFVWTEKDDALYYCQTAFGADSECDAEASSDPDADDLETGCSGFAWSELTAN